MSSGISVRHWNLERFDVSYIRFKRDSANETSFSPEFKRMAAIQGDILFQAPRRYLLEKASKTQAAFAFRMFSHLLFII